MKTWRIGSNWGDKNILKVFEKYKIVFAGSEIEEQILKVNSNDLIAITNGQKIVGVGQVLKRIDISEISTKLIDEYDDVYGLKLKHLFWESDYKFNFGEYGGQGKQFHQAHGEYNKRIKQIFKMTKAENRNSRIVKILNNKKNIILTGAPGTGKTYKTVEIALNLINRLPNDISDREKLMQEYKKAVSAGQIIFTTFHQSMDYEEFIEGLRPYTNDKDELSYQVEEGIFKKICNEALEKGNLRKLDEAIEEFKVKCSEEAITLETATKNIKFNVNYRNGKAFRVRSERSQAEIGKDFPAYIEHIRKLYIGKTKGIWNTSYVKGILNYLLETYKIEKYSKNKQDKKYVLIIDEINRGNISKIFGELITLLEADKRLNEENEIKLRLPYSADEEFGVPENVYIIGTMNTADRSLGYIDYAVRRRFAFITLKSNENKEIENFYKSDNELKEIAISLFSKISKLFDKEKGFLSSEFLSDDLMIGHSYFMAKNKDDLELKLEYEIIPLLKEYVKDGILIMTDNEVETEINSL